MNCSTSDFNPLSNCSSGEHNSDLSAPNKLNYLGHTVVAGIERLSETVNNNYDVLICCLSKEEIEVHKKFIPQPIKYVKGEEKTDHWISIDKSNFIGEGMSGKVYGQKSSSDRVVKKSYKSMVQEYNIGNICNHPNIVKTHQLYIKSYPGNGRLKNYLVMDEVKAKVVGYKVHVSDDVTRKLFLQAKDCCVYLHRLGVHWGDVNEGNILITDANDLKLIDFEWWRFEDDKKEKTRMLVQGAMQIINWIVKRSSLSNVTCEQRIKIVYPFQDEIEGDQEHRLSYPHPGHSQKFRNSLNKMKDDCEFEQLIQSYFDEVLAEFNRQAFEKNRESTA